MSVRNGKKVNSSSYEGEITVDSKLEGVKILLIEKNLLSNKAAVSEKYLFGYKLLLTNEIRR